MSVKEISQDTSSLRAQVDAAIRQVDDLDAQRRVAERVWTDSIDNSQREAEHSPRLREIRAAYVVAKDRLARETGNLAQLCERHTAVLRDVDRLTDELQQAHQRETDLRHRLLRRDWQAMRYERMSEARSRSLAGYVESFVVRLKSMFGVGRAQNPMFDASYYLSMYPDVRASGVDPYTHYLRHGIVEGRRPHLMFDGDWYLGQYPDVLRSGGDPLLHYYQFGASEGRDPHPWFDTDWYVQHYKDVGPSGLNPLQHYVTIGLAEDRDPHPEIKLRQLFSEHPELRRTRLDAVRHYVTKNLGWPDRTT